jgi:hypothetical protein
MNHRHIVSLTIAALGVCILGAASSAQARSVSAAAGSNLAAGAACFTSFSGGGVGNTCAASQFWNVALPIDTTAISTVSFAADEGAGCQVGVFSQSGATSGIVPSSLLIPSSNGTVQVGTITSLPSIPSGGNIMLLCTVPKNGTIFGIDWF